MDAKIIIALKNTSTSIELKNAVDAIPRGEKYCTAEILDLILLKRNLIVDAPTANALLSFLREFGLVQSSRALLRTAEIRDVITDVLAQKISDGDSVEKLGEKISDITCGSKAAAELYSNRKSFSAILDCFHRATTAGSARWIADSINSILYSNPGANKILNDLPVVEAFSAMIPHATTADSVLWICMSIDKILNKNETAQKMFGSLTFFEKFKTMELYAAPGRTKAAFKKTMDLLLVIINSSAQLQSLRHAFTSIEVKEAVDAIPRDCNFFAEILSALLQQKRLVIGAPTVDAVASLLTESISKLPTLDLARTTELRDFIIDVLAPTISAGVPVEKLGRTLSIIAFYSKLGAELYSNRKALSAILDCFQRATTAESAEWIVHPIYHICNSNPGANKILNVLPVVEAYSAIIPHATTNESVRWISMSIEEILRNNEPAQKMFRSLAFVEKFRSMERNASSDDAKSAFKHALDILRSFADAAASPSTVENHQPLISQLRVRNSQTQNASGQDKDEAIGSFRRSVAAPSRAHQHLGFSVELHSLRVRQQESGQRRQREGDDGFQVKIGT